MNFAISIDDFLGGLNWIDGKPLMVEPYRLDIFRRVFEERLPDGQLRYSMVLSGRAKKNFKSCDMILAALYCFLWATDPRGNDVYLVANDEGQAGDDLDLARKLIAANPDIAKYLDPLLKEIRRLDGRGAMRVVASGNVEGQHGKTAVFIGYDEIHGFTNWDLLESLQPDPTRYTLQWITSYDSIHDLDGCPLHDLKILGKAGDDPSMLFSWYSAEYTTDPAFVHLAPEQRANPSMASWLDPDYLDRQRRRLPSAKFRRLHLNLPGAPQGTFFDQGKIEAAIVAGRTELPPRAGIDYLASVDMSGGSSDDAVLSITHWDDDRKIAVLDLLVDQDQPTPFNPRLAVAKFAVLAKQYGCRQVHGDAYAGQTFRHDFADCGLEYVVTDKSASDFYEDLEVALNAGQAELLDQPKLKRQLLTLVRKGASVTHPSGQHDDHANAAAIGLVLANPDLGAEYPHKGLFEFYKRQAQALTAPKVQKVARPADWVRVILLTNGDRYLSALGREYKTEIEGNKRVVWLRPECARLALSPYADPKLLQANFELVQRLGKNPERTYRISDIVNPYEPEVVNGWLDKAAMCRNTFRMMGRL